MIEHTMHEEEASSYAIDLVCGMELPLSAKMLMSRYKNATYYFCSLNCKEHFDNAPEQYAQDL